MYSEILPSLINLIAFVLASWYFLFNSFMVLNFYWFNTYGTASGVPNLHLSDNMNVTSHIARPTNNLQHEETLDSG